MKSSVVTFCLVLHLGIAILPWIIPGHAVTTPSAALPQWPQRFTGRPLTRLELTDSEQRFGRHFPGHVARFTDGSQEIIMRWIRTASRRLHPAADCLRGIGYAVTPAPLRVDPDGRPWGCVRATRHGTHLHVCERITDTQGQSWSDVSSWYWAAVLGKTHGPWWAITIAEDT